MRKALEVEFTAKPLNILSVFQRDNLQGIIYVEARSAKDVRQAIEGLYGVFKTPPLLVPIDEMPPLLLVKKKISTVAPGTWVRIKRGKYQGDLAQVIDVSENGEEAGLKFIPRIDLTPRDEIIGPDGKKRKKISAVNIHTRPPQRFFNFEEVAKVWDRKAVTKRGNAYVFGQDTYKNGFIEKDIKTSALITQDVNPTLEEITMFAKQEGPEGGEGNLEANIDLSIIANAAKKAAISVLQPGDHVEVFEGEQSGVNGSVESITNDIATLRVEGFDLENQRVEVPAKSVRKRFRVGDHVKVMSGKNQDETGLVVAVEENIVTFISDMTNKEVRAPIRV
jgi:transcription elongation factor SPT5